jgi:hypothetical protein
MEQVPEGTELVVINEDGIAEPLATQEAADILIEGDPIWCPEGQAPTAGLNGCSPSYATFDNLITELTANAAYTGHGVIWVESSYAGADNNPIVFDATSGNLSTLSNITMQGGWDGASGSTSTDPNNPSLLDVSMTFTNWVGDLTIHNLDFQNALDANASLLINTDGDITLDNVSVTGNSSGSGADLDNCLDGGSACTVSGGISVTDSSFSTNNVNGLTAQSSGDMTLKNVTADNNTEDGISLDTDYGNANNVKLTDVTVTNNGSDGIDIDDVDGDVTLSNIIATGNSSDGVEIDDTYGNVVGSHITATGNGTDGVDIDNTNGNLKLSKVNASSNSDNGFEINYVDGYLRLVFVEAVNNGTDGVNIDTNGNILIECSNISDNTDDGLDIDFAPSAKLLSVDVTGNGSQDLNIDPATTVTIKNVDCSKNESKPSSHSDKKLYTKLFCVPGEITAALYDTYGDKVEFKNLCGYEAGIFDQSSGEYPKAIPGGEEYISSLHDKVLELLPNATPDDEHGVPGIYAQVLDELPYLLPEEYSYSAAFFTVVLEDGEFLDPLPEESELTIKFLIPDGLDEDEELTVLWWDGLEWVDLGGEVTEDGLFFQVTTDNIGIFVLAIH